MANGDKINEGNRSYGYGNVITSGDVVGKNDLGNADNKTITLDVGKISKLQQTAPGKNLSELFEATLIHEIGHNLGGNHGDPGSMMIQINAKEEAQSGCVGNCGTGIYDYTLPMVDKNGTKAIIGRMNMNYGSVNSQYISDKETKKVDPDGTVGRIMHVGN